MTIEELRKTFASPIMTKIINATRSTINTTTSYYKAGFISGGINNEHKPYNYDHVTGESISKLEGEQLAEYELGFFDGIMSDNPYLELNKRFNMRFANLL